MSVTPIVLIISRDPEVEHVSATLQAEGIPSRGASSMRELQRALGGTKGRCVAVLDGELAADPSFAAADALEHLESMPLLVLLPPDADAASLGGPSRRTEEYARKPMSPSVLALRINALILAAGWSYRLQPRRRSLNMQRLPTSLAAS